MNEAMTYEYYTRHSLELILLVSFSPVFPSQDFSDPLTPMLRKGSLLKGNIIDADNYYLQLTDERMSRCLSQDVWCWSDRRQTLVYSPPYAGLFLVAQSCLTLCDPMSCSPPDSSDHEDSPSKNTRVGCYALSQGIFPTQGLNPGLPQCRQILHHLSHQRSPRILEWIAYPFSRGTSWTQKLNQGLLHCRQIPYQLRYQGSPFSIIQAKLVSLKTTAKLPSLIQLSLCLQFIQELMPSLQNIYPQSVIILVIIFW